MLMNIGSEYSALASSIQKEWKAAETTNVPETILPITKHFEFMKGTTNDNILRVTTPLERNEHLVWLGGPWTDPAPTPNALKRALQLTTLTSAG